MQNQKFFQRRCQILTVFSVNLNVQRRRIFNKVNISIVQMQKMPSNVTMACVIFLCLGGMFGYVYNQKKQFYPTMVYLSKSGAAIVGCYVEAVFLGLIASTILRKIFFGQLRPIESERLVERCWYAMTETCLAFTIFKEETVPVFFFMFALLIFLKTFHWLTEERVDVIERSTFLSKLFHIRIIAVFLILGAIDVSFIVYASKTILKRGPSIQVVFGFEYCILLIMLLDNIIKYIMYLHGLFEYSTAEARAETQMYVSVVMSSLKVLMYSSFFFSMLHIFTLPLFAMRPMYSALKALKKSVTNVLKTRRALRYLNEFYPDATPADLANHDSSCIICREELNWASKKLPCNHIFHTACLRAWFQRQQTCPTCRYSILRSPRTERTVSRTRTVQHASTQTETTQNGPNTPGYCRISTQDDHMPSTSLGSLSEEELTNLENTRREALRSRIHKLNELSQMLDTAAKSIQQLHQPTGQNGDNNPVNLNFVREKRIQNLSKMQPVKEESHTDNPQE